ncbi:asparaginase [Streptomyces albus]|uniref:asparaginase n=1 Tax=Streptomyces albus TaxID=1888 RepID=UPI0004C7F4E8|nr:asparaginase [Streptomyces albus]
MPPTDTRRPPTAAPTAADPAAAPGTGPRAAASDPGPAAPPVLAEVVRSGFTESRHRGSLVLLAADGSELLALGDVTGPVYPRSAAKPMQAAAMLRAGARLSGERLALAAGSHSGEPFHLDLVAAVLADAGLSEADLCTPPALPLDPAEAETLLASGGGRSRLAMDCSGKHAGMLTACVTAGWPTDGYLSPEHPMQRLVREEIESATGERVAHTGTDGCGAPLMAVSLTGLARAYRRYVLAAPGSPERLVADAMRAHPEYVAGTRRHDTWLMREVPGALAKVGAEAVQAVALADGRALALKVEDGGGRAVGPVLRRALRLLGVDGSLPERLGDAPVLGGGLRVGEIRASF